MKYYAGLDVAMKETFICILNEEGQKIFESKCPTEPDLIYKELAKGGVELEKVGLETGSLSHYLLKVLQDLDDVKKFDISSALPLLGYAENRNQEDIELLIQYNQIFPRIYANPSEMSIESYGEMWHMFNIKTELSEKVKQQALEYEKNFDIRNSIPAIYPEMLVRTRLTSI